MLGAIIGDIVGSRFEGRHRCIHTKEFHFFHETDRLTDDSVMSLAVADALLHSTWDETELAKKAVACMRIWARNAKHGGYGRGFKKWLFADVPQPPYNSFGNGGAMRVGPCGYAGKDLAEVKKLAAIVTGVTHNHPEGLKSGEAVAVAIYLARTGTSKEEIKKYIQAHYYDLDFTIDGIRNTYEFSCKAIDSVPQAIEAFCEATSFEGAIRNAISIGGDSDTIAAIAGSIAEAYFGIPKAMREFALIYMVDEEIATLNAFEAKYGAKGAPQATTFINTNPELHIANPQDHEASPRIQHAIYNAIVALQDMFTQIIPGDPATQLEFSWVRGIPINPTFDDMLFRYKNKMYSIYVDLVPTGEKWHVYKDIPHLQQAVVCRDSDIIPCCFPLNRRTLEPLTSGWNLYHTVTGEALDPTELSSDKPLPMSPWDLHSFALQIAMQQTKKDGNEIIYYTDQPGLIPHIWLRREDGKPIWFIVQGYMKDTPKPPAPDMDIPAPLLNYPGFYLDIQISNEFTKNPIVYRGAVIHYKMMGIHPMETKIKIVK